MSTIVGEGKFRYEALDSWPNIPEGINLIETPGIGINSQDDIYIFCRNTEHPIMVFDNLGHFQKSFGKGIFSDRTHGMLIGPDDSIYCVDDGIHTITKFSPKGKLVMTIGKPGVHSTKWSGKPFNRPTHAAVSKNTVFSIL